MTEVALKETKSEERVEKLLKKKDFYSDFRDNPINFVLIICAVILIALILYVEIIFKPKYDPYYYNYGKKPKYTLIIYLINFIVLIIIQGEWQVYSKDSNSLESFMLFWFTMMMLFVVLEYGVWVCIILGLLLVLQIRYLIGRENRIASRISLLEEKLHLR